MVRIGMFLGDRYEILEKIGTGGMAEVFKGKDHKLNRFVAVKILKDEFVEDKNFVRKFREEAQAAAALAHPNIVNVYDVGEEQNINYIVMELVEGITLKTYIEKKGRLTVKEATSIAIQVASGLEVAHNNRIVHRDIKPQNIIISREGKVKVTDFGIAKSVSSNTNTADAMGSVHYTSPEQARGGYSDAKSDIYSLGIVMYEMVTGRVPFDGETTVVVAVKHLQEDMVSPRVYASDIPVSLEHIILKCTEKSPDRRYANVAELTADLKQSLLTPDVNFVREIVPDGAKTVAITRDEISRIKKETGRIPLDPEEAESKYAYLDHMDEEDEDGEYDEDEYDYDEDEEDYEDADEDEMDEDEEEHDRGALDPKLEKIMTIGGIVAAVIIVIIIIVIMAKIFGFGKSSDEDQQNDVEISDVLEENVEVPNLLGMSYSEAKEALNSLGLGIKLGETRSSSEYEAGQIISQSVDEGTEVEANTTIVVDICGDGEEVEVPDVKGYTEEKAKSTLENLGLNVDISRVYEDSVDEGKVISTSPAAGKTVERGSVVQIVVSKGSEADAKVQVPTITGRSESTAKQLLESAGLTSGTVTSEYSDTVEEGYVISQNPTAGSSVEKGSKVSYVVSKGKENTDVYIGNYSGMSESEAMSKAKSKGLNPVVDYEFSSSVTSGLVTRTDPQNGSTVAAGSTIKIWVSKGVETVQVPDLSGMNASQAASALSAKGLSLGTTTTGTAATSADSEGRIYDWTSKGGSVNKGSTINITVYGAYVAPTPDPEPTEPTDPSGGSGTSTTSVQ